ncbi:mitochondrial translation release factor in rescue-like [Watersipora subatra]|uniref:mitochondrial translation release factor in rescue-like n=1 Tax=Watersipora subatra TaxID=2589382 RepID=UPI00355B082E
MSTAGRSFANFTWRVYRNIAFSGIMNNLNNSLPSISSALPSFLPSMLHLSPQFMSSRSLATNKPKYPLLDETELEEKFTRGGGPGGQATNTTSNCVLLKHLPTGLVIKCHAERSLELNRKIARRRMQEKLDFYWNGENSIISQEKLKAKQKLLKRKAKTKKKLELLAADKADPLMNEGAESTLVDVKDSNENSTIKESGETKETTQCTQNDNIRET